MDQLATPQPEWAEHCLSQVESEEDVDLLAEAFRCESAGAPRLAFLGVWLSVAESIRRRFRELAPLDSEAGKVLGEIRKAEEQKKSVDRLLIDRAFRYGMISDLERVRLRHVYELRSICAHPYEENPDSQVFRSAVHDAVQCLLSKPLKLRHRFIDSQVELLAHRESFVDDVEEAVRERARTTLDRIDPDLRSRLMEKCIVAADDLTMGGLVVDSLFLRRLHWFLDECGRGISERWFLDQQVEDLLIRFPRTACLFFGAVPAWEYLSAPNRDMVIGELVDRSKTHRYLSALLALARDDALTRREAERAKAAIESAPVSTLVGVDANPVVLADRIVAQLKSHNWYSQNPAVDAVRNLGPQWVEALGAHAQEQIGRNVLQAAEGGSNGAIDFMRSAATEDVIWPAAFVRGCLLECLINDDLVLRPKTSQLGFVSVMVHGHREAEAMIQQAAQTIGNSVAVRGKDGLDKA